MDKETIGSLLLEERSLVFKIWSRIMVPLSGKKLVTEDVT